MRRLTGSREHLVIYDDIVETTKEKEMKDEVVIYHGNCADGFGAAWCFHHHHKDRYRFIPGVYQNPPPDIRDSHIYLVDFSYKREVVESLLDKGNLITLIDHHVTAMEDLLPLIDDNSIASFCDVNHSGAVLAWQFLSGYQGVDSMPELLWHIEDRDLWKFTLSGTREIQAAVFSYPYEFGVWDNLMKMATNELEKEGRAIERKHHKDIAELLEVTTRWTVIDGNKVPVANLPYTLTSDAGHALCKKYGTPFAGCYWDTPDGRVFSLRSLENGADVSQIAKKFGGGGHKHASGFRMKYSELHQFDPANWGY
jgi:uncharacterized protein